MVKWRRIKKTLTFQNDQADCGVACLQSIIKYYDGYKNLEQLRELSGTSRSGTTMLGLYQAASGTGFDVEGLEADTGFLKEQSQPVILHVTLHNNSLHFITCYGFDQNKGFIIGDPARGCIFIKEDELSEIWKSKALLLLTPNDNFQNKKESFPAKITWIKELLKDDINILSASLLLGLVVAFLGLTMAVFSQKLLDDILPTKNKEKLVAGIIIVFILLLFKNGLSYIHGIFSIRQGRDFNTRLIDKFYTSLLRLPISFFDNRKTGDMVARMNDTGSIQQTIAYLVNTLVLDFLILVVSSVFIFLYSKIAGFIIISALPVFFLIAWVFHGHIVFYQRLTMEAHAKNESNYIQTLQGIEIIKGNNKEDIFSAANKAVFGHFQAVLFSLGKINVTLGMVTGLVSVIFSAGLLLINSLMVINGELTLGSLTAILSVSSGMFSAIATLAFANLQLQGARIAFDRMFEFAAIKKENEPPGRKCQMHSDIQILKVHEMSFRFPGRKLLLKDIGFEVRKGEIVTLFGENGTGKSTILKLIQNYYSFEKGTVLFNDINSNEITFSSLKGHIAVVPQKSGFFSGTLIENICFEPSGPAIQKAIEFCKFYEFDKYFEQYPGGYFTGLGEDGVNLSGGQMQLISIARAMYRKAGILLLDEPTSSMDRQTENFVLEKLAQIRSSCIILIVTHKIRPVRISDRIYILHNGTVQCHGPHEQLLLFDNLYSKSFFELVN